MNLFVYLFHLITSLGKLLITLPRTEKKARLLLRGYETRFPGNFDAKTFNSSVRFHCFSKLMLNDVLLQLIGRSSNAFEIESNAMYYTLMTLDDKLIDNKEIELETLNDLFYFPEINKGMNFDQSMTLYLHLSLLDRVADRQAYFLDLEKIHIAQINSQEQITNHLSIEEVVAITKKKGGNTFLMLKHILQMPQSKEMDAMLYHFGGVIQMMNDLLDIHKDLKDGVKTFANSQSSYLDVKKVYDQQIKLYQESVENLPFKSHLINNVKVVFSIIVAFGYIAIENLRKIQQGQPKLPDLNAIERSRLIIDMEKIKFIMQLPKYSYLNA